MLSISTRHSWHRPEVITGEHGATVSENIERAAPRFEVPGFPSVVENRCLLFLPDTQGRLSPEISSDGVVRDLMDRSAGPAGRRDLPKAISEEGRRRCRCRREYRGSYDCRGIRSGTGRQGL